MIPGKLETFLKPESGHWSLEKARMGPGTDIADRDLVTLNNHQEPLVLPTDSSSDYQPWLDVQDNQQCNNPSRRDILPTDSYTRADDLEMAKHWPLKKRIKDKVVDSRLDSELHASEHLWESDHSKARADDVISCIPGNSNQLSPTSRSDGSEPDTLKDCSVDKSMLNFMPVKRKYNAYRPDLLPPCRVCQDRASGFHYGVNTCEACKGFFRRSIVKKHIHACIGSGNCRTKLNQRTTCSACRLKKCLEVGMSKDAIKTGRYTHEQRSRNIIEVQNLNRSSYTSNNIGDQTTPLTSNSMTQHKTSPSVSFDRHVRLTETLQSIVNGQKRLFERLDDYYDDKLTQKRQHCFHSRYTRQRMMTQRYSSSVQIDIFPPCHNQKTPLSSETISACALRRDAVNTTIDCHYECEDLVRNKASLGSTSTTGSTAADIPDIDCDSVSQTTSTDRFNTDAGEKVAMLKKPDEGSMMTQILNNMEKSVIGVLSFAESVPGFKELPKQDQTLLVKESRFDVWFIGHIRCFNTVLRVGAGEWACHAEELSQVWCDDAIELAFSLAKRGQELKLTKEETACLRAVCLTFPDRCYPLTNKDDVDRIHDSMFELLQNTASKRMNNFNMWFTKVINFMLQLREFGVYFEKVTETMALDSEVMKKNPDLLSVFLC